MITSVGATDDWRSTARRIGDGKCVCQASSIVAHRSTIIGHQLVKESKAHQIRGGAGATDDKHVKVQSEL